MDSVAVIIPTFGDLSFWSPFADRAEASAWDQTVKPSEVIRHHGETLQDARNLGAERAGSTHLIFCDADDTLDSRYVEAMLAGQGDIRRPSSCGKGDDTPILIPEGNLFVGNYIVIGAMLDHRRFDAVGGFSDLPCLEDWELFLKMFCAGATISACPDAIYRISYRPHSRNSDPEMHGRIYAYIRDKYLGRTT